jgi:HTH-type transcriptional regulator / antitoxin HigA
MIANERQYKITKSSAAKFKAALDGFDEMAALASGLDPIIVKAQRESLEGQYEDLLQQLHDYENLKSGKSRNFKCDSLSQLGDEFIRARIAQGLSQLDLSKRLNLKEQQIQRYEAERYVGANIERLSEVALALNLRMSIKMEIDDDDGQKRVAPNLKSVNIDLKKLPLKEMKKRQWFEWIDIPSTEKISDEMLAAAFLSQSIGHAPQIALFRQKIRAGGRVNMHSLFAWQAFILMKARRLIEKRSLKAQNIDVGGHWISDLTRLSTHTDGPRRAVDYLWSKGIIVVIEQHLAQTYIDGAAMLLDNKIPVIALSLRHDRLDNFWFVLFHEMGHIFLHRSNGLEFGFFDDDSVVDRDRREAEADDFAEKALISEEAWNSSFVRFANTSQEVQSFANRCRIGVSIVAGRLRKERKNFKIFSELVGQGEVKKMFDHDSD